MENFRKYHIPTGLTGIKKREFWNLKQGTMTVAEYLKKFTQLSRYATDDIPNERARKERFMSDFNKCCSVSCLSTTSPI